MARDAKSPSQSLDSFKLSGVIRTSRVLGKGCYGCVEEYVYRELKCAGKRLMPILREYSTNEILKKLYEDAAKECVMLSKLKHPNIVQFLGVHFEDEDPVPILVMEYVPDTLTRFLDRHKKGIPQEISYGILVDVARALCYLHGGDPIIIHRDLSPNNILLTSDLRAKVSDLGTARMCASVTKTMTKCPGTPAYMPCEAYSDNPLYDETLDCFSYGVLILHIMTGEWPIPSDDTCDEDHQVVVMNDIDRRRVYIEKINKRHPLLDLIHRCLNNKSKRPSAKEILNKVQEVQRQCCEQQVDRMALLIQRKLDTERKAALEGELNHLKDEKKRLEFLQSNEIKEKVIKIGTLENDNIKLRSQMEVRNTEQKALEKRVQSKDEMLCKKEDEISALREEIITMKKHIKDEMQTYQKKKDEEMQAYKKQKDDEMQAYQKQKDHEVRIYKQQKDDEMNAKEEDIRAKKSEITAKEEEINDYKESLVKKERIIDEAIQKINQRAHEDLHKSHSEKGPVMEYLRSGTQMHPLHHRAQQLHWKKVPSLQTGMTAPQCILINSSLYVGGGQTAKDQEHFRSVIFQYDTSERNGSEWKTIIQCPTVFFGLGELNGKLVMVGGARETENKKTIITGDVFVLNEKGTEWSGDVIPAMKRPRIRSCVVSFKGCIAACGGMENGDKDSRKCSSTVEIYRSESVGWCIVTPLPVPRAALRVSVIHKTAYFLGGFYPTLTCPGKPNCISIELEDLFQADGSSLRKWNDQIPDCPHESSTPASLCGSLIALGGLEGQSNPTNSVYAYSPVMKQWHLIGELPVCLSSATAITLSNGELVVLGGWKKDDRNTDVYIIALE